MRVNRRNVILGLGTIVAGGGAAIGSGAFSTVEAQRTLDVNVVTGNAIAEEFVDILLQPGDYDSVGYDDGSENADGSGEFPENGDDYASYSPTGTEISLMENDVTIVFGLADNELPPNSSVSYDNLFRVINDDGSDPQAFDVEFEVTGGPVLEFEGQSPYTAGLGTGDTTEQISVDVDTGSGSESGELTLTITEQ